VGAHRRKKKRKPRSNQGGRDEERKIDVQERKRASSKEARKRTLGVKGTNLVPASRAKKTCCPASKKNYACERDRREKRGTFYVLT